MRSILIYRNGRYEVRVTGGDLLPYFIDETELDSVYWNKENAKHRAIHMDDHNKLNWMVKK